MSKGDQSSEYLSRSLWWKKLEEEVCIKSRVKKRMSESGGDDSVIRRV